MSKMEVWVNKPWREGWLEVWKTKKSSHVRSCIYVGVLQDWDCCYDCELICCFSYQYNFWYRIWFQPDCSFANGFCIVTVRCNFDFVEIFLDACQSPPPDNTPSYIMRRGIAGSQVTLCGEWMHVSVHSPPHILSISHCHIEVSAW